MRLSKSHNSRQSDLWVAISRTLKKMNKQLHTILRKADRHWVGDGFPFRTLFGYHNMAQVLSPFLLLDYAGPMEFPPTSERLGVGEQSLEPTTALFLSGEPIEEPIVGQGPFVMNTAQEIHQAIADYRSGKMGGLM